MYPDLQLFEPFCRRGCPYMLVSGRLYVCCYVA